MLAILKSIIHFINGHDSINSNVFSLVFHLSYILYISVMHLYVLDSILPLRIVL